MLSLRLRSAWRGIRPALIAAALGALASAADAQGFSGQISYTGTLGPVGARRPLCLCVYRDAGLTNPLFCLIYRNTPISYQVSRLNAGAYYAIAFLDIHVNERLDPDEPYQIYLGRTEAPADPIAAAAQPTDIDFAFGDETLPATPTPTPSPSATAIAPSTAGDCDGDRLVSVAELVRAVGIALGTIDVSTCPAVDLDHDGGVRIDELIAALNVALNGGMAREA